MLNDYISISPGQIINLQFQIDLFIDTNYSQSQIISQVIADVTSYMNINNFDMGQNIYLGNLYQVINSTPGVLNVIDLRVYNPVGGNYSLNATTMPLISGTNQIDLTQTDYTLIGDVIGLYEILNSTQDVIIRVKS